jgi:type I restriction enzyme, S subunit
MGLLEQHFDVAFAAPDGIKKLRELILTLAMQGKLVPQDPNDEPASELLRSIETQKQQLVKDGKIKQSKPLPKITSEETPHDLPKGWEWTRLNNALDVRDGTHDTPKYVDIGYPLITSKNLYTGMLSFENVKFISKEDHEKISERSKVDTGDILFAMIGSIGNPVIVNCNEDFSIKNVALLKFYMPDKPANRYLHYFLTQAQENMKAQSSGAVQSFVSLGFLRNYLLPLPPLAEQRRIVAKIDQLMARCDELEKLRVDRSQRLLTVHTAALDRLLTAQDSSEFSTAWSFITQHFGELYSVKENVVELRKTILQLAVMGKLVRQDPNDEPSSVLVTRIKAERSLSKEKVKKDSISQPSELAANVPFQIPSSWTWQRVTDLYEVAGGIQKTPQRNPVLNFFPYLRVANVQRGRLDLNQIEYFELFDGELEKRNLQSGDLLVVEGNGSDKEIGRCAIWNGEIKNCVHQNHIIRVRPIGHNGQLFTLTFLNSPCGMAEMKSLAITTSGLYSLSVGKIREILIPFPPLAEQQRIVEKIDRLMGMCDRLEESIESGKGKQTDLLNALMSQV